MHLTEIVATMFDVLEHVYSGFNVFLTSLRPGSEIRISLISIILIFSFIHAIFSF